MEDDERLQGEYSNRFILIFLNLSDILLFQLQLCKYLWSKYELICID